MQPMSRLPDPAEQPFMNVQELAGLWRTSPGLVYDACATGQIPHVRIGGKRGRILIPTAVIVELAAGNVDALARG